MVGTVLRVRTLKSRLDAHNRAHRPRRFMVRNQPVQAVLAKNALPLATLAHVRIRFLGGRAGISRWWVVYGMSLHTFERPWWSHHRTRTHRTQPTQRAQAAEQPTQLDTRTNTISAQPMLAPSVCNRSSVRILMLKSRPALCACTGTRCCCHKDDGHGEEEKDLRGKEGGGGPEDDLLEVCA